MERVDRICAHPVWRERVAGIRDLERDRRFCRHGTSHFLDVARIARAENAERGLGIDVELIYAAALLHDIGRGQQYIDGTPHERAGAEIAAAILPECGFTEDECREIIEAVRLHREKRNAVLPSLAGLICRADKLSRPCLFCEAEADCDWSTEKKNLKITV